MLLFICFQPSGSSIWLGATDLRKEGKWKWEASDEELRFNRFGSGEPNGGTHDNCLVMQQDNGNWGDNACAATLDVHVCEKPNKRNE